MMETKEINTYQLIERITALMPLASKDETRYHLQGVYLKPAGDDIILVVSNGHIGSRETLKVAGFKVERDIMIHRDQLPFLKQAVKMYRFMEPELLINIDARTLSIKSPVGPMLISIALDSNCPKIDAIWPKSYGSHTVGLNAEYLLIIAKALRDDKNKDIKLTINFDKNNKTTEAIVVSACGNEALLMPVRV